MSVFDLLRSTNSIEQAPEPDLVPAAVPVGFPPGHLALGAKSAIPVSGPALAAAPASGARTDPPGIQAHYYIENAGKERRYYKDLEGKQLAFRADSKTVTTKQEDRATISHMLDVAQSRGWTSLHVRGSAAFKQEAWIEAQARGLAVKGYEPTTDDRRNLATRRAARAQGAEAEPGATMQPPQENTLTNTSQPQPHQHQAQAVQPTQPAAPVSAPAPAPAASAASQQVADGSAQSPAGEGSQRPDRKADGAAKAAEPGADAGQPAGRPGEAKRDAPAAQSGDKPAQQQEYPRQARDPWMDAAGGYAALSPAQQGSAERSHERWIEAGTPEKPHTMDLEEYVGHVQDKRAEARAKEARPEAKAGNGKGKSEAEAAPAPRAPTAKAAGEKVAAEGGAAEAVQLSPQGRKVLAYIEERIGTQMAKLTDDEKANLRTHAVQAIAKREREVGPVQLPAVKADRKQQAGRDQAAVATKRKVKDGGSEQKPAQIEQPRMRVG